MSVVSGWGWSHNLNGFFLLINGLSAGGQPLWTPDALTRVGETASLAHISSGKPDLVNGL
jgi:hypothetical protein